MFSCSFVAHLPRGWEKVELRRPSNGARMAIGADDRYGVWQAVSSTRPAKGLQKGSGMGRISGESTLSEGQWGGARGKAASSVLATRAYALRKVPGGLCLRIPRCRLVTRGLKGTWASAGGNMGTWDSARSGAFDERALGKARVQPSPCRRICCSLNTYLSRNTHLSVTLSSGGGRLSVGQQLETHWATPGRKACIRTAGPGKSNCCTQPGAEQATSTHLARRLSCTRRASKANEHRSEMVI